MSLSTQHAPRKAREAGEPARGITTLAEGKLYALQNLFPVDGRVSTYPASARGFSVANSYLLTESDAAMLIDTGFGKDEAVILAGTDHYLAFEGQECGFPVIDCAEIHIDALYRRSIERD